MNAHNNQAFDKKKCQPCIYTNYLVDDDTGIGPTYAELRLILSELDDYRMDHVLAREIDTALPGFAATPSSSKGGLRRYLSDSTNKRVKSRVPILQKFHDALKSRIEAELSATTAGASSPATSASPVSVISAITSVSPDDPMPHPLCEFGYTIDAKLRSDQHRRHNHSKWLMNLTEAICVRRFGRDKYRMKFYVVYCIPSPPLSPLAEAVITVIGQGYVANGGGFSFQSAGESTDFEIEVTDEQALQHLE